MRTGIKLLGLAVAVMVVVSTSAAMAQRGQGQGRGGFGRGGFGGGFGGGGASMLLGMEQIQKELDLSDDQKEAIQKVFEESRQQQGERPNFQDLSDEERQKLFTEMREKAEARGKEVQKKVDDILLPNQKERLAELRVQSQARFGLASALTSADVADKLKLSDEQKEKLQALAPRMGAGFGRGGQGGGQRGERPEGDAPRLSREERDAKAKEVLTADQLAQFEKMQGKKFEFPEFGGRGGRGGEGGGERGRRRGQPDA